MSTAFLTCFGPGGYQEYAKRMLESWAQYSRGLKLICWYHDCELPEDAPKNDLIEYRNLTGMRERQEFIAKYGKHNGQTPEGYNYRIDAIKFCNKVFAIAATAQEVKDWLIWLDADTALRMPLSQHDIDMLLPTDTDVVHLGRNAIDYSETSFMAFNLASSKAQALVTDLWSQYVNGEVFGYREFHDGFVVERLLRLHIIHGLRAYNLTPNAVGLNAWAQSPLGIWGIHYKGPNKQPQLPNGRRPIRVIPQNCVPDKTIAQQLTINTALIDKYLMRCKAHNGTVIIVSGGPSVDYGAVKKLVKKVKNSGRIPYVVCVKHSYPDLLKNGIVPFACVLLDPRPIDGVSTHGKVRRQLLDKIDPNVIFMTASMTDPSVIEHLKSKKANIVGWHAYTGANKDQALPPGHFFIMGGTCAGVRSIGIFHTLGFRDFHLFGYDSCWADIPDPAALDEQGRPKYMQIAWGDGPQRWTTGELLAQAQDFEELMKMPNRDFDLEIYGEGLVQDMVNSIPKEKDKGEFVKWLADVKPTKKAFRP